MLASLLLSVGVPSAALAMEPGSYAVQCATPEGGRSGAEVKIRMDWVDIQTLKSSLGTIISGVSITDGSKIVVIASDRHCTLFEVPREEPAPRGRGRR
jgi:hypothetical protein